MPKVAKRRVSVLAPRDPIPSGDCAPSTRDRRARARIVKDVGFEMGFRCERCEEKNLKCFVSTDSGECAGCIAVHSPCSLFVPEDKWKKVQEDKRKKRLEIARLEAQLAKSKLELLETEETEHSYADRDLAILDFQGRGATPAEGDPAPSTVLVESLPPEPLADARWLQADFDPSSFFDPSYLFSDDPFLGASYGTPVPMIGSP